MSVEEKVRRIRRSKVLIGILLTIVSVVGIGFFYMSSTYQTVFSKGTRINGIDVSGMTVEEAERTVCSSAKDYQITLNFREDKTETIFGREIDYQYVNEYDVQEILDEQNSILWFWNRDNQDYHLQGEYSIDKLKKVVNQFPEMDRKNMVKPKDAAPVYEDGTFAIAPEVQGTTLKKKAAISYVGGALKECKESLDMEEMYQSPKVYSDDATLNNQILNLNDLVGVKITYNLPDGSQEVLDRTKLVKWLSKDNKGNYVKKKAIWNKHMRQFVSKLAKKVNTISKPRKFKTTKGKKITLAPSPYYGWKIDEEKELERLAKELKKRKDVERKPVYASKEAASLKNNYGFGKTYVEVDLTKQHLWVYVKGKKKLETDVVSGKNDPKHKTPAGAFTAYDKRQNKILRGERRNGRYEYETKVSYWIRLTPTGVGLHDASWRPRFGGNIWVAGGSHGCINLPASAAAQIYQLVSNGDPVIVYY